MRRSYRTIIIMLVYPYLEELLKLKRTAVAKCSQPPARLFDFSLSLGEGVLLERTRLSIVLIFSLLALSFKPAAF